jgi:hypothetical protein
MSTESTEPKRLLKSQVKPSNYLAIVVSRKRLLSPLEDMDVTSSSTAQAGITGFPVACIAGKSGCFGIATFEKEAWPRDGDRIFQGRITVKARREIPRAHPRIP